MKFVNSFDKNRFMKLGEHAVAIDVSCERHYHIYRGYDLVYVEKNVNVFLDLSDDLS